MKSTLYPDSAIDKKFRENYIQNRACKTGAIESGEAMKEQLLAELTSKNDRYAWALTEKILAESQETDQWYDCFADFASLLSHPKALVRNRGFSLLAANVQWDDENRFDAYIAEFLSHITDEKPISARQCIQALAQIGREKPRYIPLILTVLHNADLSKYKDSMRPLIEKDMAEVERLLTGSGR